MKKCCICGKTPQWHHQIMRGGRALNEAWAILPLCPEHHDQVNHQKLHQLMDWVALNRATKKQLDDCSHIMKYKRRRAWLNSIYGEFRSEKIRNHYANIDF